MELSTPGSKIARFGLFEADLQQRVLTKGGLRVKLQDQPFQVLALLLEHPGEVVKREEIRQRLWPANTFVEFDDGLNTAIKKLRLALNDAADNPRFIETVPRRGYRFLSPVSFPAVELQPKLPEPGPATSNVIAVRERSRIVIEGSTPSRFRFRALVSLLALAVLAGLGYYLHWGVRQGSTPGKIVADQTPRPSPRRAVAVLGFRNASGRPDQAWISTALAEMLSTELSAREKLRIVPEENIARSKLDLALVDSDSLGKETLSRLRAGLGTDIVVLGSYTSIGQAGQERLRLDVRLQDAVTGETLDEQAVSGTEGELFELAALVGARLRDKLGVAELSSEESVGLRASLPSSALAMRLYAEGLSRLRLFDGLSARDLLLKSIAADPNYALSHSALAQTWNMLGFDQKAKQEGKKALDLSDGLSRPDRLLVEGTYREGTKEWDRASEIYRALVDSCPDNPDYALALARTLTAGGKAQQALAVLDQQNKLPLSNGDARLDLARSEALLPAGDLKQAESTARAAAEKAERTGARILWAKALYQQSGALLDLGDLDRAVDLAYKSEDIYSSVGNKFGVAAAKSIIGGARWYQGKKDEAVQVYQSAYEIDNQIGNRRGSVEALSYIGAGLADDGNLAGARKVFEQAIAISREINAQAGVAGALSEVAWTYLAEGDLVRARKLYEQTLEIYRAINSRIGEGNTLEPLGLLLVSQGELALADTDLKQALKIANDNNDKISECSTLRDLGILAEVRGDDVETRQKLNQAIELAKANGDSGEAAYIKMWLAKLNFDEGRAADSASALGEIRDELRKTQRVGPEVQASALAIKLSIAQGKTDAAEAEARSAKSLADQSPFFEEGLRFRIALGVLHAVRGKSSLARNELSQAVSQAKAHGFLEEQFEARVELGRLEMASGKAASGKSQLESVNKDATAKGYLLLARSAANALSRQ